MVVREWYNEICNGSGVELESNHVENYFFHDSCKQIPISIAEIAEIAEIAIGIGIGIMMHMAP